MLSFPAQKMRWYYSITDILDLTTKYFFQCLSEKIRLARLRIHMKHQASFSAKDKSRKNKSVFCCNFAWLFKGYNFGEKISICEASRGHRGSYTSDHFT